MPAPALGLVLLLAITLLSENVNNRSFVAMAENIWSLPFLFALYVQPANVNPWIYWAIASLQQAFPYVHAIQVAWVSRNSGSVRTRAVSASVYNMTVQVSKFSTGFHNHDADVESLSWLCYPRHQASSAQTSIERTTHRDTATETVSSSVSA